ncbi:hypothetical protein AB0P21_20490 [Kribbella sp. NPDC056861]|uniref:hypothetical protein n=1 Tax=Kribbella sp. NPDC056861 TaxID=3154857 RepID=UPI003448E784
MTYLLQARSTGRDLWVVPDHPGMPSLGPWRHRSGGLVSELVADGEVDRLGFTPRFKRTGRGQRVGDLIWTTGDFAKIASLRFVRVLEEIGATGFRTFPVDVVAGDGSPLGEFVGLAVLDGDESHDLRFSNGVQFWEFAASDRVVEALRERGVTELSISSA